MENLNKRKLIPSLSALVFTFCLSTPANATSFPLEEYGINIDGTTTEPFFDPLPSSIDISDFDDFTGLGTIDITITGAGDHSVVAYFDHDIDESINTFFNETGSVSGVAATGQTWEIDDPINGDIYFNLLDSNVLDGSWLDNTNSVPASTPDDVSMAMGWDFNLAVGDQAVILFVLGTVTPTSGFFLEHNDPDSGPSIFLSSTLNIFPSAIPVPAAVWLFGSALIGLVGFSRRRTATH